MGREEKKREGKRGRGRKGGWEGEREEGRMGGGEGGRERERGRKEGGKKHGRKRRVGKEEKTAEHRLYVPVREKPSYRIVCTLHGLLYDSLVKTGLHLLYGRIMLQLTNTHHYCSSCCSVFLLLPQSVWSPWGAS